ncbi:putative DNA primase/helicase [Desulfobotulus alkaliphilus]|uniref:Putative DNA primase/helicase n=1 Tax=Desulfobotulus alkaliphilus TaxID=622671 RepID=A0A562RHF5_9BACT|nr:phage/plasmid primase, P4 family [Desulfobotulus alkaliphilus]TWI68527.1 putative DNA primase/helicase [Desulfobotulus alkaliphilus]
MGKAVEFLNPDERAAIARGCFQVDPRSSNEKELRGLCPFHDDQNASFSYSPEKDAYNCLACGASGDLIKLWGHAQGKASPKEAFQAFCGQYKPQDQPAGDSVPTTEQMAAVWDQFPPLPPEMCSRLCRDRAWTEDGIKSLDLRLQTLRWNPKLGGFVDDRYKNRIAFAVRDDSGEIRNIRSYMPGAREFKLLSVAKGMGESRLWPHPSTLKDGPVWICEGEPDVICARSHGINAITQTTGALSWKKQFNLVFEGRDVVLAYDADGAGIRGADKAAASLSKVAASVRVLKWPDFMGRVDGAWPESGGQDLTDWFAKHRRSASELEELLGESPAIQRDPGRPESVERFFSGRSFQHAKLARELYRENPLIFDTKTKTLYRWNGKNWASISEMAIQQRAQALLQDESTMARISDATSQVAVMAAMPAEQELDNNPDLVPLENGMLSLSTAELLPHVKEHLNTYRLPVSFDPDAKCERWLQFLTETIQDAATIAVVQEWFGYCLTRDTSHEKAMFLIGPGSDGKSTFLHVIQELIGERNSSAVNMADMAKEHYRATLIGKLLNTASETEGAAFESDWFKAIVSGDKISASFKFKDVFDFSPYVKLMFANNRWPKVKDNSDGFYRRILPIKFKRQFKGKAIQKNLRAILIAELPGILLWALVGLERLRLQGGFTHSDDIHRTLVEYQFANNPVQAFVDEECLTQPEYDGQGLSVSKKGLYDRYRAYCTGYGFHPMNIVHFSRELLTILPHVKETRPGERGGSRQRHFDGVAHVDRGVI